MYAASKFDNQHVHLDVARLAKNEPIKQPAIYVNEKTDADEVENTYTGGTIGEAMRRSGYEGREWRPGDKESQLISPPGTESRSFIVDAMSAMPRDDDDPESVQASLAQRGQDDDADRYTVSDSSSDSSYDMEYWDDDGRPLIDADTEEPLYPMEAETWYTEQEADMLIALANSYRATRSGLQKTRTGRDQKRVIKYHQKHGKSR